jgi:hypothetical protein
MKEKAMQPLLMSALLAVLVVSAGCGARETATEAAQTGTTEAAKPASPPQGEGHAAAGVVPGSYEDWCVEHGVPESQCTRCDPSLIPAFQAANDWCAEHGLPMSQCTIHNPNLKIVRPPKPEGK